VVLPAEDADRHGTTPQTPARAAAPRRSRARRPGKTARIRVAARSSGRKAGKPTRQAAKK